MTTDRIETLLERYTKSLDDPPSRPTSQLEAFASKLREIFDRRQLAQSAAASSSTSNGLAPSAPAFMKRRIPRPNVFFVKSPPYTLGRPSPEYAVRTSGTAMDAYYNIEALGDASTGHLSVGVAAGVYRNADWSGNTYYSDLPDRWLFGDAISSAASILQIVDVPQNIAVGSNVYADVQISWDPRYPSSPNWRYYGEGLLYDAIDNVPGLSSSALNGFVGVTAAVELVVSLVSGSTIVGQSQVSSNILSLGVDAEFAGKVTDKVGAPYLFLNFAFASNPWAIVSLRTGAQLVQETQQMLIDTTVRLFGLRGGVSDPDAGHVNAAFMDFPGAASPVSWVPLRPNPFVLNRITAFSVPS
jgi:hypothetical protein